MITSVGKGAVDRPGIVTDDDLIALNADFDNLSERQVEVENKVSVMVPEGRTINGHELDKDITLTASDVGSLTESEIRQIINQGGGGTWVPVRVNGHLLDKDITLTASDVGTYASDQIDAMINGRVPTSRTVNGKPLTSNVSLAAGDVGAPTKTEFDQLKQSAVPSSRTINGILLDNDITLTPSSIGAVPTSFTINGQPMTGTGMTISGGGGVSRPEVEGLLTEYIKISNEAGLAHEWTKEITGKIADNYAGGGFYSYNNTGGGVDAPSGSTRGELFLVGFDPDPEGNSNEDLVACPGLAIDRGGKGVAYRTVTADGKDGPWNWLYGPGNPQDAYTKAEVDAKDKAISDRIDTIGGSVFGNKYTNVTSSRNLNVTYTNSTERDLYVCISVSVDPASSTLYPGMELKWWLTVDGVDICIAKSQSGEKGTKYTTNMSGIVPKGATYRVSHNDPASQSITLEIWSEL